MNKSKSGFTLVEILVAMVILITIIGLATFLYVRAARIRKLISYQNDIASVLNSMATIVADGDRTTTGLKWADDVANPETAAYDLFLYDRSNGETVFYRIAPGMYAGSPSTLPTADTDTTLWQARNGAVPARNSDKWKSLDLNKKVILGSGSSFRYFNSKNEPVDNVSSETITSVQITLRGLTTDPGLAGRPPIVLQTLVRLRNKLSF
jgi:prepilin-type N-terminal cleavage/methylation domain-containing protein